MLLAWTAAVAAGLALTVWGADRFVLGASATAVSLRVPPLVIGLVIVGFATSAPEVFVALFASFDGQPALGIGNAIGSNIANITLILGLTALVWPLTSHSPLLRREMPLLIGVTLLAIALLADGRIDRIDGAILVLLLLAATTGLVWLALRTRHGTDEPLVAETMEQVPAAMPLSHALGWLAAGFVILLTGARLLVWGATHIAMTLGVSDLVIGLTVVAVGTSLPELATAIVAAFRRQHDLIIGGVIGSNLFNTLAVLGLPALFVPAALPPEVLTRDLPAMVIATLLLLAAVFYVRGGVARINRVEGFVLLSCFIGYQAWILASL